MSCAHIVDSEEVETQFEESIFLLSHWKLHSHMVGKKEDIFERGIYSIGNFVWTAKYLKKQSPAAPSS